MRTRILISILSVIIGVGILISCKQKKEGCECGAPLEALADSGKTLPKVPLSPCPEEFKRYEEALTAIDKLLQNPAIQTGLEYFQNKGYTLLKTDYSGLIKRDIEGQCVTVTMATYENEISAWVRKI